MQIDEWCKDFKNPGVEMKQAYPWMLHVHVSPAQVLLANDKLPKAHRELDPGKTRGPGAGLEREGRNRYNLEVTTK